MNEEKQNKQYYQETFHEVHAPQALAERMRNMNDGKHKKKAGTFVKGLAVAAAAAVVFLIGGDGIAYATTGSSVVSTWVEKFFSGPKEQIVLEDDRVYIVDGDVKIDVTDELREKGQAIGTYEKDGSTKDYCVLVQNGQHILDIRYYSDVEDENGLIPSQSVFILAGTPTPTPEQ